MKVVIAIDSFKGCMTTNEVSQAVERGIKSIYHDANVIKVPIADGGEGTVEILNEGLNGTLIEKEVHGPRMALHKAHYSILKDGTAVIEMASAAGLPLLKPHERNPLLTTTYGVGELIMDAIDKGCRNFILGIGGSATNDGGIGMLKALGYKFYDQNHMELDGVGQSLIKIANIDEHDKLNTLDECKFLVACDVDNPFYGPNGAAYVYARQKGADDEMIELLDQGLRNFSNVIQQTYGIDLSNLEGAGAAGGLGGGINAFLNGTLMPGIDIIFKQVRLEEKLKDADFIITGEGKMDFQSVMGKLPAGVAKLGKKYNIPVIAICGHLTDDAYKMHDHGITSLFSIMNQPMTLEEAMDTQNALHLIESTTIEIFHLIKRIKKD